MKKFIFNVLIAILILSCSDSKEKKIKSLVIKTEVSQHEKEDPLNLYNSENINSIDILEALDFMSVQIHKFKLGEFDKKRNLILLLEEFEKGDLKTTDTLAVISNEFYESHNQDGTPNMGFIDQIKIFTKTDNEKSEIMIKTYQGQIIRELFGLNKNDEDQFFLWRVYKETNWEVNKKIPLMVFASSWFDERINNHRFCGIAKLTDNTEDTNELLNNSPNYIMISYKTQ
jgi:hypothetical protein